MNKSQVKWEACGLIVKVKKAEWLAQVGLGTYISIYIYIYIMKLVGIGMVEEGCDGNKWLG